MHIASSPRGGHTMNAPHIFIRTILFTLLVLIPHIGSASTETSTYTISFSFDDFSFENDENGCVQIIASELDAVYPESNVPGLPLFSYNVAIDGDAMYLSSNPKYTKHLVKTNVTIAQSPIPVPTNSISQQNPVLPCSYPQGVYPQSNCQYATASEWDNIKMLHFQLCPFVYDAKEKNLYFIDRIDLDITTGKDNRISARSCINTDGEALRAVASNVDAVENILSKTVNAQAQDRKVDYVIITSKSLKNAFEPLLKWKKAKGIYAEIATIENIKSRFSGYDTQFAIKCYLYELYHRNSLKYVLLGGDDTVVPVRGCYSETKPRSGVQTDSIIPTDMYYACFGGDFTWDANGNGLYGETIDNLNLAQSVYVSRIPIRTPLEVEAYVNKLIAYERNPKYNDKILMGGNIFKEMLTHSPRSDAEGKGDHLYDKYIKPYWQGRRYKFYDTHTDFEGGADYDFTATNLARQLEQGYDFVDINTHGDQALWKMEKATSHAANYNSGFGLNQTNSAYTIITTSACHTNAFDSTYGGRSKNDSFIEDPCLSESLIRNPQSGVIAYLGCSREGWDYPGTAAFGPSMMYEVHFYKNLFDTTLVNKNFAKIVSISKAKLVTESSYDGFFRWLQFGLNPIGDPEMPIFTEEPKTLNSLLVIHGIGEITAIAGEDGCRICVMSNNDNGESYYQVVENVETASFSDVPLDCSLCITKPGYIPKVYEKIKFTLERPFNKITDFYYDNGANLATVDIQLDENASSPQIIVSDIMGNTEKSINISNTDTVVSIDASAIRTGVHIVSLVVDGGLADSCRFVK